MKNKKKRVLSGLRKAVHRAAGTALCGTLIAASLLTAPDAAAAPPVTTTAVPDMEQTGSITLYKLLENGTGGSLTDGSGLDEGLNGRTGMAGIVFRAKKIADLSELLVTESGGGVRTGVYYTSLDTAFLNAYTRAAGSALGGSVTGSGGITGYPVQDVINAVTAMQKSAGDGATYTGETLLRDIALAGEVTFDPTDANGRTSKSGLPTGLYLVAEDEAAGTYTAPDGGVIAGAASPFLISLPMTSLSAIGDAEAGTVWQYDVTAYPKNSVISTAKYSVSGKDGKTLVKTDDWQVGDVITQAITGDAPKPAAISGDQSDKAYVKYVLKDEMTQGLSFLRVTEVRIGGKAASPAQLPDLRSGTALAAGDYKVETSAGKHDFTVALTDSGLARLNALEVDAEVTVLFEAALNGDAVITGEGGNENRNKPVLIWRNKNDLERQTEGTPVTQYTYGIDLTKSGVTDFGAVTFVLKRQNGSEDLKWIREKDGTYHVAASGETGASAEMHPGADGHLHMRGLDAASYTLTEKKTQSGRTLLASPIGITLKGRSTPDGILESAEAEAQGRTAKLTILQNGQSGIAGMTVSNQGQIILKTGGTGRAALGGVSAAVLAAAFIAYARLRRKCEKK